MSPLRRLAVALVAVIMLGGVMSAAAPTASAKEVRSWSFDSKKVSSNKYKLTGNVIDHSEKKVYIKKAKCKKCAYKNHRSDRTTKNGKYVMKVKGKIGNCFQIVIPGNGQYKKVKKRVGCIVRVG